MNKSIFILLWLATGIGFGSTLGQGTLIFNNVDQTDGEVIMFKDLWTRTNGIPLNQDLNFELATAMPGGTLTILRKWLLSDGSANGINISPGRFADPSRSVIMLPSIPANGTINAKVDAWGGNYDRIGDAINTGAPFGFGLPFTMGVGSSQSPVVLMHMPLLAINGIPEPRPSPLFIVGGLTWALFRSHHKPRAVSRK